ncbi:MAG: hypothetical protein ACK504_02505 [Bacteroidota bacterium]|jgi:hypothetical protein
MKTKFILTLTVLSLVFASCKKKETDTPADPTPTPTPSPTYVISKDSTVEGSSIRVGVYEYNSSKKLVRVKYKLGASTNYTVRDTVIYNANGQVSQVNTLATGSLTPLATSNYSYNGNLLTSVNETVTDGGSPYVRTRSYTYTAGLLSTISVNYSVGSPSPGKPENFTAIAFLGGNISSANLTAVGALTFSTSTAAPNPYYGLNFRSDDILNNFNQNNVLSVFVTASPSTIIISYTYTYADGRVITINESKPLNPNRVTTILYKTL